MSRIYPLGCPFPLFGNYWPNGVSVEWVPAENDWRPIFEVDARELLADFHGAAL